MRGHHTQTPGNRTATGGPRAFSAADDARPPSALILTHDLDPRRSMESRLGWFRAQATAKDFLATVICAVGPPKEVEPHNFRVVTIPHSGAERTLMRLPGCFYLAYRLWQRRVFRLASQLHAERPFALVHQVSYCGYREPGECWKLDAPFVWGPIGGTQNVPWRFLGQLGWRGAIGECWRSVANSVQVRYGFRSRQAFKAAHTVLAANRQVQRSFQRARGIEFPCQLETGVDEIASQRRSRRDENRPLRILWAGRLECWKALPLLLKALDQLPCDIDYQLRVIGSGSRESRLKRLAKRLGLQEHVDWVPLPPYDARPEHYRWADVFAFTSLRDTSGTGLLEALAAGVPVIGLDHQGARDIMTTECAVPIPVETPTQVVAAFRGAIEMLAKDAATLQRMGAHALGRADCFRWERLGNEMRQFYADAVAGEVALQLASEGGDGGAIEGRLPAAVS